MRDDLLANIGLLKNIIHAKKTHTSLDKLHLDLLKRAERFFEDGDELRAAELCTAVTALDKSALASRKVLSETRRRYSENCRDDLLDVLLEKYFGKYILSEPLNELSSALTRLRAALLDNNVQGIGGHIHAVRSAAAALPDECRPLERLIEKAADRTEELIALGETEHACALVDAVHPLPEIAGAPRRSLSGYKICFVKPFAKRYKDGFFESTGISIKKIFGK
ncbi:MAG: hypothetical protein K2N38_02725 [Oscillospiraceae bacterium]|nr:hypothetical protein [Oscillospiraceae bacterium]